MKNYIIIFLILLFCNCSSKVEMTYEVIDMNSALKQLNNKMVDGEKIFKKKFSTNLNQSEIKNLKKVLISSIKTYNEKREASQNIRVSDYQFYFVPTIDDKKQKWIFIYGLCEEYPELNGGGLPSFFMVEDGGSCYIQTVINLTKEIEGWININSKA